MAISNLQARALLAAALRSGESLEVVAFATAARSLPTMLLLLFGLPAGFLAVVFSIGVDTRSPLVASGLVGGLVVMLGVAIVAVKRLGPRYLVGLTQSRLLVARVVDRSCLRTASVIGLDRETLFADGVRTRDASINSTNVHLSRGILILRDARVPHELQFLDAALPGNLEAFHALELAITRGAQVEAPATAPIE